MELSANWFSAEPTELLPAVICYHQPDQHKHGFNLLGTKHK
jgi:hypothetical protein